MSPVELQRTLATLVARVSEAESRETISNLDLDWLASIKSAGGESLGVGGRSAALDRWVKRSTLALLQ